ncbi:hypothetical protein RBH89_05275 [Paracidovorax avenae]
MASRPIFTPSTSGNLLVWTHHISFEWFPGMAKSQAQKSIMSLHENAKRQIHVSKVLEISSKSLDELGVALSAFNLMIRTPRGDEYSLECAYQSAKVFERGGPFKDLRRMRSIDAKRDSRLLQHGRLVKFSIYGMDWDLQPRTAFYDWLYINALHRHPELVEKVLTYRAFSDIAFNPERSINCQAYSAALYVSLHARGLLTPDVLKDQRTYLSAIDTGLVSNAHENTARQKRIDE